MTKEQKYTECSKCIYYRYNTELCDDYCDLLDIRVQSQDVCGKYEAENINKEQKYKEALEAIVGMEDEPSYPIFRLCDAFKIARKALEEWP